MLAFQVQGVGFKEAEKALENIKMGYPRAASEAINRGLLAGQTAAAKAISARYYITSGEVKENFDMKKASWVKQEGNLIVNGKMLNVSAFKITTRTVKAAKGPNRQVVSAQIIRGTKVVLPGAFVNPRTGRVMERRQPSRYPIWPVSTISVAHMSGQTDVADAIQKAMAERTAERLAHNVEYALKGGAFAKE